MWVAARSWGSRAGWLIPREAGGSVECDHGPRSAAIALWAQVAHGKRGPVVTEADRVIFINYRRTDAGWPANALAHGLIESFGPTRVFLDIRSVTAGDDFIASIEDHLRRAAVLLVLVAKDWLHVHDTFGRRRLDSHNDWVRREIRHALANDNCRVIPVYHR